MAAEDGENYMTTIGILNMRFNVIRTHQKLSFYSMPVARQKGESQNGGNKKTKHNNFSEKRTFLTY